MILDSQSCRDIAALFNALKGSTWLETPQLQSRHSSIQAALSALAGFFESLASMSEMTEYQLLQSMPYSGGGAQGFTSSFHATNVMPAALSGKLGSVSTKAHYAHTTAKFEWSDGVVAARADVGCLEGEAVANVSIRMWEKGKLAPDLKATGTISASAINMGARMSVGNEILSSTADVKGEIGSVYAKATAIVNARGVEAEFKAGAALARAVCVLNVDILGLKLALTMTGIAGGVEASGVYKATTNSWEAGIGGSLGFGGSIKLGLSWD